MGAISGQILADCLCLGSRQRSRRALSWRRQWSSTSDNAYGHRSQSNLRPSHPLEYPKPSISTRKFTGEEKTIEALWRQFFADPSQWWDYRFDKTNFSHPDFKHKLTKEALWIDKRSNPEWIQAELMTLEAGAVQQSAFMWNTMIKQYARTGKVKEAMQILTGMQEEGVQADNATFHWILKACSNCGALEEGRHVHSMIAQSGWESDVFVGCGLVDMYAKCGSIEDACESFNRVCGHNSVSWTSLITGYVKYGQSKKALELNRQMQLESVKQDSVTYGAVLNACANSLALDEGRCTHAQLIESGCKLDDFLVSCLVDMYAKCGSIEEASKAFLSLDSCNLICWTAMMSGYVRCGSGKKALELYHQMQLEHITPDPVTFVSALHACASITALKEGRHIHAQIVRTGYETHPLIEIPLIDMYVKCGSMHEAWKTFSHARKHYPTSWSTMIISYVKNGLGEQALELYRQMQSELIQPDCATFLSVLQACASIAALEEGRHIHAHIIHTGLESDAWIQDCLVDMYVKCGSMEEASTIFTKMIRPDVVCWTSMISGFVRFGQGQRALKLYRQMQLEQVDPDPVTFVAVLTACASIPSLQDGRRIHAQIIQSGCPMDDHVGSCLIEMYAKCGSIEDAGRAFNSLKIRNVVCWTAIMTALVKSSFGGEALQLYQQMQLENVKPDAITFVAALNACASTSALQEGRWIHSQILKSGDKIDNFVLSSLIDMYSKSGCITDACRVFNHMERHDEVSYNSMIGAFSTHGHGRDATNLFDRMCRENLGLSEITFVSILTACSHACLIAEGQCYFESMNAVYGISANVDHYACIVDLLGRAGHLTEAENIVNTMPTDVNVPVWRTLLGACRIHGNMEMGERIAEKLFDMEPEDASGYVLLCNIYASASQLNKHDAFRRIGWENRVHRQTLSHC